MASGQWDRRQHGASTAPAHPQHILSAARRPSLFHQALERQLHPLVPLLGLRGARTLLHPCFERALHAAPHGHAAQAAHAGHALGAPDFPSSSQATMVQDHARSRPATQRAACLDDEGAPDPKR